MKLVSANVASVIILNIDRMEINADANAKN